MDKGIPSFAINALPLIFVAGISYVIFLVVMQEWAASQPEHRVPAVVTPAPPTVQT